MHPRTPNCILFSTYTKLQSTFLYQIFKNYRGSAFIISVPDLQELPWGSIHHSLQWNQRQRCVGSRCLQRLRPYCSTGARKSFSGEGGGRCSPGPLLGAGGRTGTGQVLVRWGDASRRRRSWTGSLSYFLLNSLFCLVLEDLSGLLSSVERRRQGCSC